MFNYDALKIINLFVKALYFEEGLYSAKLDKGLTEFKTRICALEDPANQYIARYILKLVSSHKPLKEAMLKIKKTDPQPSNDFGITFDDVTKNVNTLNDIVTNYLDKGVKTV